MTFSPLEMDERRARVIIAACVGLRVLLDHGHSVKQSHPAFYKDIQSVAREFSFDFTGNNYEKNVDVVENLIESCATMLGVPYTKKRVPDA